MRGVIFGEFHTVNDWNLILTNKSIDPPEPKTTYISVDGRDGDLDISEALTGEIRYRNRNASFTFLATEGSYSSREALIANILSAVHGQKLEIVEPDNPDNYLVGRCRVTDRVNNKAYASITIECNCEPWYYADTETSRSFTISSSIDIVLVNSGRKTVSPEITVTGSITLAFGTSSVSLSAGTYKLSALKLESGNTTITLGGSGTVVFTYREGVL